MNNQSSVEGHDVWHDPVMAEEITELLVNRSTRLVLDCTVGAGGHAARLLDAAPQQSILYGIDLDRDALRLAAERLSRFGERVVLKRMNFSEMHLALPGRLMGKVDALLIDCGISRLQIVTPGRGFSFDREGDLDMRFDQAGVLTAGAFLAATDVDELRTLLVKFGERVNARRIARAIIRLRDRGELKTTLDLARAVKSVVKRKAAKSMARTFLAIRERVNRELESLVKALDHLPQVLAAGGRACIISYHSEEDRIVKRYFRRLSGKCVCPPGRIVCDCGKAAVFKLVTPKPLPPTAAEIERNPSARSAKIRVVEKM
jgi:16S rRNA (cytosine1402-N4)-methyltransferase